MAADLKRRRSKDTRLEETKKAIAWDSSVITIENEVEGSFSPLPRAIKDGQPLN